MSASLGKVSPGVIAPRFGPMIQLTRQPIAASAIGDVNGSLPRFAPIEEGEPKPASALRAETIGAVSPI